MPQPTVLILAGGENSRFFPLNTSVHKAGTVLAGEPLIVRSIKQLQHDGYQEFVIVAGSRDLNGQGLSGLIAEHLPNTHITWVEQPKPLGMGDAVLQARQVLTGEFIVTSAYHSSTSFLIKKLLETGKANAVLGTPTDTPWKFGILEYGNGLAKRIIEKPAQGTEPSNLHVVSVYLLGQKFLELLAHTPAGEYSFEEALNKLMQEEKVGLAELAHTQGSLKYAWDLFDFWEEAQTQLKSYRDATARIAPSAILDETEGPIYVGAGAKVSPNTRIVGPAYIGDHASIGDFCLIRNACIEAHAQIGAYTEVVRSIIMSNASIHQSYLADSILGLHVKVGAGLTTANKRFDRAPVHTVVKGSKVSTNRRALGIIVGEQTALGIRTSTMPGVLIAPHSVIAPATILTKNVLK